MKPTKEPTALKNGPTLRCMGGAQRGQSFVLIAVAMAAICGIAAIVFDVGTAYIGYQQLRAQTQAAALAAGSVMSNDGETISNVDSHSDRLQRSCWGCKHQLQSSDQRSGFGYAEVPDERCRHR